MGEFALKFLGLFLLAVGGGAVFVGCYYFVAMLAALEPNKKRIAGLLAPISIFVPSLWTEEGNKARRKLFVCIAIFLLCFAGAKIIVSQQDEHNRSQLGDY